ncbi:MAG: dienelactone hydrolase family protein [Devosia sp.]
MTPTLSGPLLPPKSGGKAKQVMLLLHGYGADGNDLIGLGWQWRELFPDMVFVAPNAPEVCAQNPGGYQWFPLNVDRIKGRIEGAEAARPVLINFLIDLWAQTGLGPRDTIITGFSQGAMMALHLGTSLDQPLKAIVAFSGALIPPEGFASGRFAKPPVALVHGEVDQVVDPDLSRESAQVLADAGFEVRLHISPGAGHGIAPDGLQFATQFLLWATTPKA